MMYLPTACAIYNYTLANKIRGIFNFLLNVCNSCFLLHILVTTFVLMKRRENELGNDEKIVTVYVPRIFFF